MNTTTYVGPWDGAVGTVEVAEGSHGVAGGLPGWPGSAVRGRLRVAAFLVVTLVVGLLLAQLPVGGLILFAELSGRGMGWVDTEVLDPVAMPPLTLLMVNLTLAGFAPAALIAGRLVLGLRPGRMLSAAGRWRWWLAGRTALCVVPLWLGYLAVSTSVDGLPTDPVPPQAGLLLLVVVVTTPLQVLGEEVLFRLVPLVVCDGLAGLRWLRYGRGVGVVGGTAAFVLAHGSADVAIDASLAAFALVAAYLTVTSEGLEQAWVVHLTNNLCTQVSAIVLGGWGSSFIGQADDAAASTSWTTLAAIPTLVLITLLVRRSPAARRTGQPAGVSGSLPSSGPMMSSPRR